MDLIKAQTMSFDVGQFRDRYREALLGLIEAKVEGKEVEVPVVQERETPEDLMTALKASLESIKKSS